MLLANLRCKCLYHDNSRPRDLYSIQDILGFSHIGLNRMYQVIHVVFQVIIELASSQPVRSIFNILDLDTAGPLDLDFTGLPLQALLGLMGSDFTDNAGCEWGFILDRDSSLSFGPMVWYGMVLMLWGVICICIPWSGCY